MDKAKTRSFQDIKNKQFEHVFYIVRQNVLGPQKLPNFALFLVYQPPKRRAYHIV